MHEKTQKIALIVPSLAINGGISTVADFLYQILDKSNTYIPDLISIATSSKDEMSLRVLAPSSWLRKPNAVEDIWRDRRFIHVGAFACEFEFQRYAKRKILTDILNNYDLIQLISGSPAFANALVGAEKPVCAFVATLVKNERQKLLKETHGIKKVWRKLMTKITSLIEIRALSKLSHIFAESRYTYNLLSNIVAKEKLSIGFPGIDDNLFSPIRYNEDGYILSVGRFRDPRKNIPMLFHSYCQLLKIMPSAPDLVLAGKTSPSENDWQLANILGIRSRIIFRENVSFADLIGLYQNASLFLLSSDEEGLGIVILEAMACGIPVISTDCGGPETLVKEGQTGCLIPVGDYNAMAIKSKELLSNLSLRYDFSFNARRDIEQLYSFEAAGRLYLSTYDRLLGVNNNEYNF